MAGDKLPGYKGQLRKTLEAANVAIGDLVRVESNGMVTEGILMPRLETADDWHLILKLRSGYNIGISFETSTDIKRIKEAKKPEFKPSPIPEIKPGLPKVSIISTGGTIASRVDYITGGVHAAISSRDLLSIVPELSNVAEIDADILYSVFSENINTKHWTEMAHRASDKIKSGASGVIITHGTDTMGYSSAALSFALQNLPVPIVFVGSQRSSDRPSSDAATNLIGAVTTAAQAPFAEVTLAMHESSSDTNIVIHRGTKVRKCHTSTRYAFRSINNEPLARLKNGNIEMLTTDYRPRRESELRIRDNFEEKVALIKFYPGFDPNVLSWFLDEDYKGLILEGSGLGHVSSLFYQPLNQAVKDGVFVGMTSQCIWGRIDMNVYTTGRELLRIGVEPLEDMLSETALVKLMWALGQSDDIDETLELMRRNIAGEYTNRTIFLE